MIDALGLWGNIADAVDEAYFFPAEGTGGRLLQPVASTLKAHAPTGAGVEFDKLGLGAVALAHNLTRAAAKLLLFLAPP